MKPTDLWGAIKGWTSRPHCKNGDNCHEAAPRGSQTGTQGIKEVHLKSRIPFELSQEIYLSVMKNITGIIGEGKHGNI